MAKASKKKAATTTRKAATAKKTATTPKKSAPKTAPAKKAAAPKPAAAKKAAKPAARKQVAPTEAQIRERARQIWMERGRPAGQDEPIWLEAERQLREDG